jgi:hypothetical protein
MDNSEASDRDELEAFIKKYAANSNNKELKGLAEKLESLKRGEKVGWKNSFYPKQTIRVQLKIEVPESLSISDLLEELKVAEQKLNEETDLIFKIEFGS